MQMQGEIPRAAQHRPSALGDITNILAPSGRPALKKCPSNFANVCDDRQHGHQVAHRDLSRGRGAAAEENGHRQLPPAPAWVAPVSRPAPAAVFSDATKPSAGASGKRGLAPEASSAPTASPMDVDRLGEEVDMHPQHVTEYSQDIYAKLYEDEHRCCPRPDYMEAQRDLNGKMRAILVDWIVEVQFKYRLLPETLFLTVSLIDRYLSRASVARTRLQLVGVAAMFIAAKYEEIHPPEVADFVYISDNVYTKEEVLEMECSMLSTLQFYICCPTVVHFLDRLVTINKCNELHRCAVQYASELALLDIRLVRFPPSHLAASAMYLTNELMGRNPVWPTAMAVASRKDEYELGECASEMLALLRQVPNSPYHNVRKKFSSRHFSSVAHLLHA